jgi:ankyrin repeat protein
MSSAQEDEALIYAARNGHLDTVKYLVSQGADVHAREDEALIDAGTLGCGYVPNLTRR